MLRECLTFAHVPTSSVSRSRLSDLTFYRSVSKLSCAHLASFSGVGALSPNSVLGEIHGHLSACHPLPTHVKSCFGHDTSV
jgi:hypothetical protein